jgi:hypothetical protein
MGPCACRQFCRSVRHMRIARRYLERSPGQHPKRADTRAHHDSGGERLHRRRVRAAARGSAARDDRARTANARSGGGRPEATVTGHLSVAGTLAPVSDTTEVYRYAGGMVADLPSLLFLAHAIGRVDDSLIRTMRSLTTPVGKGGHFMPGLAQLDLPGRPLLWRGGSAPGFTTEIVAALDGSAAVVLLVATHPAKDLRDTGIRILHELLDG